MPLAEALARAAVPLAGLAAMAAFAAHEVDLAAASESVYLAVVATAVLAAVAFLAPSPAIELGLGSVLATAAVWVFPAGPGRGAAVLLLLVATLAVAAGRRLARCPAELPLPIDVTVPLALGLQALLRGDLLLAPRWEPRVFLLLLLLPVAGALWTSLLTHRHGRRAALAAGLALAVTPGFTIATTLVLVALAGGDALAATAGRTGRRVWAIRLAAAAAIAAPLAWGPTPQRLVAAAAGLVLASPSFGLAAAVLLNAAWVVFQGLGAPQVVPMLSFSDSSLRWLAIVLTLIAWLAIALFLVPAVIRPAPGRGRWLLAGGLLALAARGFAPAGALARDPLLAALAAPVALLALAIDEDGAAAVFQRAWAAALLAGTALFAAYPWLRARPLDALLELLGPVAVTAPLVAALVLGIDGIDRWGARRRRVTQAASGDWRLPVGAALAALFVGIAVHLPPPATQLVAAGGALRLSAASPAWETRIAPREVSGVSIDSTLENSADLRANTLVAILRLGDGSGRDLSFQVLAGGTAEWAARRPDVARVLDLRGERVPPAWVSWVAGGFFGQRYRQVFRVPGVTRSSRMRIELAPGLPPDLALALYRVELLQ